MAIVRKIGHLLKQGLIAKSCFICGQTCQDEISICHYCQSAIPKMKDVIGCIGKNISISQPNWNDAYAFYEYKDSIQLLLKSFKFKHDLVAGKILKCFYYDQVKTHLCSSQYDVIIPMPIHLLRNLRRGFNQSTYLAKYISKQSNIPVDLNYIKRIKFTRYQNKLSLTQRKENMKQAFKVVSTKKYKSVLVIDDVITTGFSLDELSRVLNQSGIEQITVCALAIRLKNN